MRENTCKTIGSALLDAGEQEIEQIHMLDCRKNCPL